VAIETVSMIDKGSPVLSCAWAAKEHRLPAVTIAGPFVKNEGTRLW
jgi:hypothetical protein